MIAFLIMALIAFLCVELGFFSYELGYSQSALKFTWKYEDVYMVGSTELD